MKVKVEIYNGIPLSASIPKHVTCTVKEAQPPMKGIAATPKYVCLNILQMLFCTQIRTLSHYVLIFLSQLHTANVLTHRLFTISFKLNFNKP